MNMIEQMALSSLLAFSCSAQVQEAWVQRYNGGFTNVNHTPVAMVLDSVGNIYVAGSSQDAGSNYDYVVLKYAPDGSTVWAARWPSPGGGDATISAFAVDAQGNSYATGTGGTVKWGADGSPAWSVPYLANDIAVGAEGSVYVTGLSVTEFATLKLDTSGSNVWVRTWNSNAGQPAASQQLALDQSGNLYVAGWAGRTFNPPPEYIIDAWLLKYDSAGDMLWACACIDPLGGVGGPGVNDLRLDGIGDAYVSAAGFNFCNVASLDTNGTRIWVYGQDFPEDVSGMILAGGGGLYITGGCMLKFQSATGAVDWEVCDQAGGWSGIALDSAANVLVTGVANMGGATANGWITSKYDSNGNLLWAKLYNGPTKGNDGGIAIAVAPDGGIVVTGYSANAWGGSDMTTIKYVQTPTILALTSSAVIVQVPGPPGQSLGLGATTDFSRWTELGPVVANTNGLFQFIDTNAALYPQRFYRWHAL